MHCHYLREEPKFRQAQVWETEGQHQPVVRLLNDATHEDVLPHQSWGPREPRKHALSGGRSGGGAVSGLDHRDLGQRSFRPRQSS